MLHQASHIIVKKVDQGKGNIILKNKANHVLKCTECEIEKVKKSSKSHSLDVSENATYPGIYNMSLVLRKPVFGVSDQVQHKLDCTVTEDG